MNALLRRRRPVRSKDYNTTLALNCSRNLCQRIATAAGCKNFFSQILPPPPPPLRRFAAAIIRARPLAGAAAFSSPGRPPPTSTLPPATATTHVVCTAHLVRQSVVRQKDCKNAMSSSGRESGRAGGRADAPDGGLCRLIPHRRRRRRRRSVFLHSAD
jgi:hypothetical protein